LLREDGIIVLERLKRYRLLPSIPMIVVTGQDTAVAV
jgi:CheY-like chemotaxis protein